MLFSKHTNLEEGVMTLCNYPVTLIVVRPYDNEPGRFRVRITGGDYSSKTNYIWHFWGDKISPEGRKHFDRVTYAKVCDLIRTSTETRKEAIWDRDQQKRNAQAYGYEIRSRKAGACD